MAKPTHADIDAAVPVDGEPSRQRTNELLKNFADLEHPTAEEMVKLRNIDQLKDRSQHTGVQPASTISDLPDLLAAKVNAEPGKGLSQENFTTELRNKLEQHEDPNFKGVFLGLAALQSAYPGGAPGQYATVDDGEVVQWYAWNSTTEAWEPRVGESTELTPQQVAQYYESIADRNAFRDEDKALVDSLKQEAPVRKVNGKVPVSGEVSLTIEDIGAQPKQRGIYGPAIPALNRYLLSSSHTGTSELRVSAWGTVYGYDQFNLLAADGRITIPSWAKLARVSAHLIPVQSNVSFVVEIRRGTRYGAGDQNTPAVTPIMKVSSTDIFEIIVRITSGAAVTFNTASWLCIELYE